MPLFQDRQNEALAKIAELQIDAKNKADYIALDEIQHEIGVMHVEAAFYVRRVLPHLKGA